MTDRVVVTCHRPYDFPDDYFVHRLDQFRNALYLPPAVLDCLDVPRYGYVRIRLEGTTEPSRRIVTAPLDPKVSADFDTPQGALRTHGFETIAEDGDYAERNVVVEPADEVTEVTGETHRTYDDDISDRVCHLSSSAMAELEKEPGDLVELCNPETGGRIDIVVGDPHEGDDETVRIDVRSRQALHITPGEPIRVRSPEIPFEEDFGFTKSALNWFIGTRQLPFHVVLGPDQDEYRHIVRISADMMQFLGIDEGDNVVLKWRGEKTRSQCLAASLSDDHPPNTVQIPSTERDAIDVSVHDGVTIERDMGFTFREQLSLSLLGILAVVIGVLQVLPLIDMTVLYDTFGVVWSIFLLVATTSLLAIGIVWLLLTPERQRCSVRDDT